MESPFKFRALTNKVLVWRRKKPDDFFLPTEALKKTGQGNMVPNGLA